VIKAPMKTPVAHRPDGGVSACISARIKGMATIRRTVKELERLTTEGSGEGLKPFSDTRFTCYQEEEKSPFKE
jgi:hypothetical protein